MRKKLVIAVGSSNTSKYEQHLHDIAKDNDRIIFTALSMGENCKKRIGAIEAYFWNNINKAYKYIDKIICCSEFMKRKMDTNPLFAEKTVAMHNFIDIDGNITAEKSDYVLYFGRFSYEKGIDTLT